MLTVADTGWLIIRENLIQSRKVKASCKELALQRASLYIEICMVFMSYRSNIRYHRSDLNTYLISIRRID